MNKLVYLQLIILVFSGCRESDSEEKYLQEIETWQEERIQHLKAEDGWLNIVGLLWLEQGENTIGTDSSNSIVFPGSGPEKIGTITLKDTILVFYADESITVTNDDQPIKEIELKTEMTGNPTLLKTASYGFFIIKRGEKYGIRLRDYESPHIDALDHIEMFPVNMDWIIEARWIPFDEPVFIDIPDVLGMVNKTKIQGKLEFEIEDQTCELYPMDAGKRLFIILGDETSGLETYGGGRFMYVEKPGRKGIVKIDFNRAYNPPCVFTHFATCPLPPAENILPVKITAGEKNVPH
jgi:uncharacterized protein (DUF1684 family)